MDIRDKLNSGENYAQMIDKKLGFIKRDLSEYDKFKDQWESNRVYSHFARTFMYQYQMLISKYSMGMPVSYLFEDYKQCIFLMEKGWHGESGYVQMIWMLSIGIMLEIDHESFKKLTALVERDDLKDYLVDFLIKHRTPSWRDLTKDFLHPSPYKEIHNVVTLSTTDKHAAVDFLKKYLQKKWYSGHKGSGWYDDHKSKWGVHFGYWSFESGALVKILSLDDSGLKGQQYYPYDMVHWKE